MLNFFTPSLEERKRKSYLAFKQDEQQMNKSFFFFYIKQITSQSHINMKSNVAHTRKKQNKQGKNNHV